MKTRVFLDSPEFAALVRRVTRSVPKLRPRGPLPKLRALPSKVEATLQRLQAEIGGQSRETGYLVRMDGSVLLKRHGAKDVVRFTAAESKRVAAAGPLVFLHNHPKGSSFSDGDLTMFAHYVNFVEMRVVARDGAERVLYRVQRQTPRAFAPSDVEMLHPEAFEYLRARLARFRRGAASELEVGRRVQHAYVELMVRSAGGGKVAYSAVAIPAR
jgi:hypothetical protein